MISFRMCQTLIPNDFLKLYRKLTWKNIESREFLKKKNKTKLPVCSKCMAGRGTKQKWGCWCSSWKIPNSPLKFCGSNKGQTGHLVVQICYEARRQDGVSCVSFFWAVFSNFVMQLQWQMREREREKKLRERTFFDWSLKFIWGSKYPQTPSSIFWMGFRDISGKKVDIPI